MGVKKSRALSNTVVYIIMTIMALIIIYPVFYALCGSLKTNLQLMSGESLLPTTWEFQNFIEVWKKANFASIPSIACSSASSPRWGRCCSPR